MFTRNAQLAFGFVVSTMLPAHASVVEVGDLNIIVDLGNPSDGLRYLDLSFSAGLSLADALAVAQTTYPNARESTPQEQDDLFAAADIIFNAGATTAGGFNPG